MPIAGVSHGSGDSCRGALALTFFQRFVLLICLFCVFLTVVVRPLVLESGSSGDFRNIYKQGARFWAGENVYAGGNPYLPSVYVVMAYQTPLAPDTAWLAWRCIGIALVVCVAISAWPILSQTLGTWHGGLALANVLMLSGMSPWSGNPGNLASICVVLGYLLATRGKPRLGGFALGVACGLKYSIGLPFVALAFLSRQWRLAVTASSVFVILNAIAFLHAWTCGTPPVDVVSSLLRGVRHVGGYDQSGFQKWFMGTDPYRFQLMNMLPLLNSFGLDRRIGNALCLAALGLCAIFAGYAALRKDAALLTSSAVFGSCFLLFTYHRFYDSAILAFAVLLAWTSQASRAGLWRRVAVLTSIPTFLSVSNIIRTRAPDDFIDFDSWLWNYVIGPHHVYALAALSIAVIVLSLKQASKTEQEANTARQVNWV